MVSPGSAFPAPSIQLPPVQPDCGHLPLPTSSVDVDGHSLATASVNATHHQPSQVFSAHRSAPVPRLSRLIHARTGNLVFIGDSANLCFLQIIRRLIHQSLGPCTFTEDPLRHMLVEATPSTRLSSSNIDTERPFIPDTAKATALVTWYLRATHGLLGLFDPADLRARLSQWQQQQQERQNVIPLGSSYTSLPRTDSSDGESADALFFLVLAIGAQTGPDDQDDLAQELFEYGRFLIRPDAIEEPRVVTVQTYVLLVMFLLGASRRNAAFMYLGIAIRAAHSMGIHHAQVNAIFDDVECATRERLWKVLRILDTFLSASMGRPPSTIETRDTKHDANYSASNDLCTIFEAILTDVYSRRMVSTTVLEQISEHHRFWAARYTLGLSADGIPADAFLEIDGVKQLNIGLCHLKEAYYWTVMLISQPFLIETVSRHISTTAECTATSGTWMSPHSSADRLLTHACVNSAVCTLDLLQNLLSSSNIPKRLPFIINSLFVSALVLGLAQFGDLDCVFPLESSMAVAHRLLAFFGQHDPIARRYMAIISNIQEACNAYLESRVRRKMERQRRLIGGMFGTIEESRENPHPLPITSSPGSHHSDMSTATEDHTLNRYPEATITTPLTDTNKISGMGQGNDFFSTSNTPDPDLLMNADHEDREDYEDSFQNFSEFSGLTDIIFSTSPRTLAFESFDSSLPLFPTMDASLSHVHSESISTGSKTS